MPAHQQRKIACLSCHYEGGKANWNSGAFESNGTIKREWIRISKPSISNRSGCHGLTGTRVARFRYPRISGRSLPSGRPGIGTVPIDPFRRFDILSRGSRDLFSQFIRQTRSPVPLGRSRPEIIRCTDCHFAPNNPQRPGNQTGTTAGLRGEPRQETLSEYLKQPDHRLATANCRICHEPQRGHGFLPYPERHLQVVACESCRIPRQFGPAEQMVDATLLDESGSPLMEYQGVEADAANLNTAYTHGSEPALLAMVASPG